MFAAALAAAALVFIPARHRYWRLAAVLGWISVWIDGHAGLNPIDLVGLTVAVGSVVAVLARQHRESGDAG